MLPVLLASIKTRDHIPLEGIVVLPQKKRKTALVWLHGISGRFSSGQALIKELSHQCTRAGIGYFKFNTRGHDVAFRAGKKILGGGFEKFDECVGDIRAMIRFARTLGFQNIILAGHSTGANKALYYVSTARDRAVKGLVLVGAVSDRVALRKEMGARKFAAAYRIAARLRKNPHALMPREYGLFSARRFWSLCHPGEKEDTFPYYDAKHQWKALESVHIPLAVIIGTRDQYLDRSPRIYLDAFHRHAPLTKRFSGIIIKGANHGFKQREKELAHEILGFIQKINGL